MNSDEQLNRQLDRVQPPSLSQNFHEVLFAKTRPAQSRTSLSSWFENLFPFPQMMNGALFATFLVLVVVLVIGVQSGKEEALVTDMSETEAEFLWLTFEEELSNELNDDEDVSDTGVAELYAVLD
jgi:hypothetical protein